MTGKPHFGKIPSTPTRSLALDRGQLYQLVGPNHGGCTIDVHINEINIDSGPGEIHYHKKSENVYIVLEGCLEVVVEGERHLLYKDDFGFVPPGLIHTAGNAGTHGVCRVIEIYAPAGPDFHIVDSWPGKE